MTQTSNCDAGVGCKACAADVGGYCCYECVEWSMPGMLVFRGPRVEIQSGQYWVMRKKARERLPEPPEGWPREVTIKGTLSSLGVALVAPDGDVVYPAGQRIQIPFSILRRYYVHRGL